jgi:hypothetical protein
MSALVTQPVVPPVAAGAGRPGKTIVLPGQTPKGEFILGVLVKRTYDIALGRRCTRAEADQNLVPGDVSYGDPLNSSIKLESDFVPFKLATDVVLNGRAYAPGGNPVPALTAALFVGPHAKEVLVIGDRVCCHRGRADPVFTEPKPFKTMELRYERAYGGVDIRSDPKVPYVYPRNPLGRGFVVATTRKAVDNLELPNLEDPGNPVRPARLCTGTYAHWERQPMPQGFSWYSKYWQPRAALAGVLPADRAVEQQLRKAYAQAVPPAQRERYEQARLPDMDFRFFNGASLGLALPFLSGDEEIRAVHLTPEGEIAFQLPGERPRIGLDIGSGVQEPVVVLHTVMIRMEERQVDLVWRAAVAYPGPNWLPEMRKMEVSVQ